MPIHTVSDLRKALSPLKGSLPIDVLDQGSDTGRPWQVYHLRKVEPDVAAKPTSYSIIAVPDPNQHG